MAPIGLGDVRARARAARRRRCSTRLPRKTATSTKYRAGHVLVVGGSPGLTGAPTLAALAAFRADAGYVTLAAPESSLPVLEAHVLEAVKRPLPEDPAGRLLAALGRARARARRARRRGRARARASAAATARATSFASLLEQLTLPVVLDADALWELEPFLRVGADRDDAARGRARAAARTEAEEIDAHRLESVRRAASRFGATVLLKGAGHAGRRAARGRARRGLRAPVARDRRDRRRARRA